MEHLIIDTDPGVDDALAILMAGIYPQTQIEAILAVAGNVALEHTVRNAGVILDQLNLDIPIYAGCAQPLVAAGIDAGYVHGHDGIGNTGFSSTHAVQPEHAALALLKLVNAEPGKHTLVALGPLTNIAVALKLDSQLPRKLKRLVLMAGAVTGHGNMQVCTEFNVLADPEAAHVVFAAWGQAGCLIELIDWEVTMRYGFTAEMQEQWAQMGTAKSDFFTAVSAHANQFIAHHRGRTTQYFADPVAMAVALEPDIVTKSEKHYVAVELNGRLTRGQTIVDWEDRTGQSPNAKIMTALNGQRLFTLVNQALT